MDFVIWEVLFLFLTLISLTNIYVLRCDWYDVDAAKSKVD